MRTTHIPSVFPVDLTLHEDGRITLKDVQGEVREVKGKDGSSLGEDAYNRIVEQKMSYWAIHKYYRLTPC